MIIKYRAKQNSLIDSMMIKIQFTSHHSHGNQILFEKIISCCCCYFTFNIYFVAREKLLIWTVHLYGNDKSVCQTRVSVVGMSACRNKQLYMCMGYGCGGRAIYSYIYIFILTRIFLVLMKIAIAFCFCVSGCPVTGIK